MKTDRYRYIEWTDRESGDVIAQELYDHEGDPGETVNIANRLENAALVAQLSGQLRDGWRGALPAQG